MLKMVITATPDRKPHLRPPPPCKGSMAAPLFTGAPEVMLEAFTGTERML